MRSVLVTPLLPPFDGAVVFFDFEGGGTLAVSRDDGERIAALLNNSPEGREITMVAVGDKVKVEVVLQ